MSAARTRPIYNNRGWVLGRCSKCNRLNYVEPHGTTAKCRCSEEWTEHANIPYDERDISGCRYIPAEFSSIEDAELMVVRMAEKARAALAKAGAR